MKLGDTITITGVEFVVRAFTAAEHQAFDQLADEHQLQRKAAEAQALAGARGGTAREALLRSDIKQLTAKLRNYLTDSGELNKNLSEAKRLQAYETAALIDEKTERLEALREERTIQSLMREEQLAQARENVIITFMHTILKPAMAVEEFAATLTPTELAQLDEVVALGKLRVGLSALTRLQAATLDQQLRAAMKLQAQQQGAGSASASRPQPPAAPAKPGTRGRSKTSSSKSTAGN